jgi:hypothetical protein
MDLELRSHRQTEYGTFLPIGLRRFRLVVACDTVASSLVLDCNPRYLVVAVWSLSYKQNRIAHDRPASPFLQSAADSVDT